jgi:hypothetical protein
VLGKEEREKLDAWVESQGKSAAAKSLRDAILVVDRSIGLFRAYGRDAQGMETELQRFLGSLT